jgi:hypothetical protein
MVVIWDHTGNFYLDKAKHVVRRGRKATGLFKEEKIAGLPGIEWSGFIFL